MRNQRLQGLTTMQWNTTTFLRDGVGLRFRPQRVLERLLAVGHTSGACRGRPVPTAALCPLFDHSAIAVVGLALQPFCDSANVERQSAMMIDDSIREHLPPAAFAIAKV